MAIILFADDDCSLFDLLMSQFKGNIENNEFSILHAKNGTEALKLLKKNEKIEILISDLNMPEIDGLELLKIVKDQYPRLKTIVMTAHGDIGNIRDAMNQGAYDFIIKPFVKSDLLRTIRKSIAEIERFNKMITALNAAEEANRLKSEFLANVSHELLTPMHGILSFSELGIAKAVKENEGKSSQKYKDYFSNIQHSAERLLKLISDLLKLSQLESGQEALDIKPNDISHLIQQNLNVLKGRFEKKSIQVDYLPEKLPVTPFDENLINEVLHRILENAVQFSPEGSVVNVEVEMESDLDNPDSNRFLKVAVSDQGPGVPENELHTIFEKFYQSSFTKTGAGGRGLGLAICKEIILRHAGKIWVENKNTIGATFYFRIPA